MKKIVVHCTLVKIANDSPSQAYQPTYETSTISGYYNIVTQGYKTFYADGFNIGANKELYIYKFSGNSREDIAVYPEGSWFGVEVIGNQESENE